MNWNSMYSGYIATPQLWRGSLEGIEQLELLPFAERPLGSNIPTSLRLGSIAEYFTFEFWQQSPQIEIISRNVQIQGISYTLGEIDALIRVFKELVHVEIAYKVYLYDPNHGDSELEHWIGPNRKDTLVEKLNHLRNHQLPLIATTEGHSFLESVLPCSEQVESRVWMKGQLFLPLNENPNVEPLNHECIMGRYATMAEFSIFSDCKFYLPTKQQWMSEPTVNVNWKSFESIFDQIEPLLEREYAPMLWKKSPNGIIEKLFVVWWS